LEVDGWIGFGSDSELLASFGNRLVELLEFRIPPIADAAETDGRCIGVGWGSIETRRLISATHSQGDQQDCRQSRNRTIPVHRSPPLKPSNHYHPARSVSS